MCLCERFPNRLVGVEEGGGGNNTRVHIRTALTHTGEARVRRAVEEKLQAAESQRGGEGVRTGVAEGCWGEASRSDEAEEEIGAEVRHPEESVLVDFGSVKSQKNMLNIWSLVQRGEGSEGPPESTGGEVLKTTNTPGRREERKEGNKDSNTSVVGEVFRSFT